MQRERHPQRSEHLTLLTMPLALRCTSRNPVPNGTAPSYKIRTWGYVPLDAAGHFRTLEVKSTASLTTLCGVLQPGIAVMVSVMTTLLALP